MKPTSDLDINRGVRRVLVKHWIDLGRLSVRTTSGVVYLYGRLQRLPGATGPVTPRMLEAMFYEIKRIKAVRRINPHFENWTNSEGFWKEVETSKAKEMPGHPPPSFKQAQPSSSGDD